jgi:hypothetical protein
MKQKKGQEEAQKPPNRALTHKNTAFFFKNRAFYTDV